MQTKIYGHGDYQDEGGCFRYEERPQHSWVRAAQQLCTGCHDNFYNNRANCTGNSWCFSLKKSYGKRKTRPRCYH